MVPITMLEPRWWLFVVKMVISAVVMIVGASGGGGGLWIWGDNYIFGGVDSGGVRVIWGGENEG